MSEYGAHNHSQTSHVSLKSPTQHSRKKQSSSRRRGDESSRASNSVDPTPECGLNSRMSNTLAHPTSISSRHDRIQPISEQPIPSTAQSGIASRPGYPVSCFGESIHSPENGVGRTSQISNPFTTPQDPSFHSPVSHSPHPLSSTTLSEPSRRSRLAEQSVSFSPSHTQSSAIPASPLSSPFATPLDPNPSPTGVQFSQWLESTPPQLSQPRKSSRRRIRSQCSPDSPQSPLNELAQIEESPTTSKRSLAVAKKPNRNTKSARSKDTIDYNPKRKSRPLKYQLQSPITDEFVSIPIEDMTDVHGVLIGTPSRFQQNQNPHWDESNLGTDSIPRENLESRRLNTRSDGIEAQSGSMAYGNTMQFEDHLAECIQNDVHISNSPKSVDVVYVQSVEKTKSRNQHRSMLMDQTPLLQWMSRIGWIAKATERITYTTLVVLHSFYTGLCLYSLFLFPINTAQSTPTTTPLREYQTIDLNTAVYTTVSPQVLQFQATSIQDTELLLSSSFRFLLFYSGVSGTLSYLFQVFSTFAFLSALQAVSGSSGSVETRLCRHGVSSDTVTSFLAVPGKVNTNETIHRSNIMEKESPNSGKSRHERPLPPLPRFISSNEHGQGHSSSLTGASHSALASFIANMLMVPIDLRLSESQSNLRFGGAYGDPNWFFDPALLTRDTVVSNLRLWMTCNAVRGVMGMMCWILCILSMDRERLWCFPVDLLARKTSTDAGKGLRPHTPSACHPMTA
ncbi:hypothetical protein BASA83_005971 [Batrachochytrium salamandrivorans]|nr:hypothetical protein BASA83_005971 [Batrachochytrium salamandrivorans]